MYVCDVHTIIFTKLVLKYTVLDFFLLYNFSRLTLYFFNYALWFWVFFGIVDTYRWYY